MTSSKYGENGHYQVWGDRASISIWCKEPKWVNDEDKAEILLEISYKVG